MNGDGRLPPGLFDARTVDGRNIMIRVHPTSLEGEDRQFISEGEIDSGKPVNLQNIKFVWSSHLSPHKIHMFPKDSVARAQRVRKTRLEKNEGRFIQSQQLKVNDILDHASNIETATAKIRELEHEKTHFQNREWGDKEFDVPTHLKGRK